MRNVEIEHCRRKAEAMLKGKTKLKTVLHALMDQLPQTRRLEYAEFDQLNSDIEGIIARCGADELKGVDEFLSLVTATY